MDKLRTPNERFDNLPDYDFSPNYVEVDDYAGGTLRIHYIDEGPHEGRIILCMHGEPSWSYLYRKMIPVFVEAGNRVIAPDLVGFGKSDKPILRTDYTYLRHVEWIKALLIALNLTDITLVCQDWGGLIGLRLAAEIQERFARIVAANTGLPTGSGKPSQAFLKWREFSQTVSEFPTGKMIDSATVSQLSSEVIAAYDAPFPDESYKAGARVFPSLVPITPDDPASEANRSAWKVLRNWTKPFLTAFSDSDPITKGGDRPFQERIPGAKDQPHTTIEQAGHFLQEDKGEELAQVVIEFMLHRSHRS